MQILQFHVQFMMKCSMVTYVYNMVHIASKVCASKVLCICGFWQKKIKYSMLAPLQCWESRSNGTTVLEYWNGLLDWHIFFLNWVSLEEWLSSYQQPVGCESLHNGRGLHITYVSYKKSREFESFLRSITKTLLSKVLSVNFEVLNV